MRGTERIEVSLCEKSMKVMANVMKLSAFSIAKRSFGTTDGDIQVASGNFQPTTTTDTLNMVGTNKPLLRAQRPQTITNHAYLVEPAGGVIKGSSSSIYVVKEDMNVDGRAADYVRKVHVRRTRKISL